MFASGKGPCVCVVGSLTTTVHQTSDSDKFLALTYIYPGTTSPICISLRVVEDPESGVISLSTLRDIPSHFFIGTMESCPSFFQPRCVNGLLLTSEDGKFMVPPQSVGLHNVNPAGRLSSKSLAYSADDANVRITTSKHICPRHFALYTTRYIRAGERLMTEVSAFTLKAFTKRHRLTVSVVSSPPKALPPPQWTFVNNDQNNPFDVHHQHSAVSVQ